MDSRDSLRSSFASLTAVLTSSGFAQRASPFQSARSVFGQSFDLPAGWYLPERSKLMTQLKSKNTVSDQEPSVATVAV